MVSLRPHLVVQTQSREPESRALCGLYSINNAMQVFNFIDMKTMKAKLCQLESTRPGEDHGSATNGHYSILAFQEVLRERHLSLVHLNRVQFLRNKAKSEWPARLARTSLQRLLIIGQPAGQLGDIYHCIASTSFNGGRYIIDPDEGQRTLLTEASLRAFLPVISSVYAILSEEEMVQFRAMLKRAKARALARKAKSRLAREKKTGTKRQRRIKQSMSKAQSSDKARATRKVQSARKSPSTRKGKSARKP